MKTTNLFDYPTAAATTYKAYKQATSPDPLQKQKHYQQTLQQTSLQQRNKVKNELQKKKQQLNQQEQSRIKEQIEKKRRQLQQLEEKKMQAIENQKRAAEIAKIKQEQDKIRAFQEQQRAKENEENAQFRFKDALRRLQAEKDQLALPERQAQQRRKANLQAQKVERGQAIKFKEWLKKQEEQDAQNRRQEQERQIELMRNGLGRIGLPKSGVDYSKTCLHNPHMVFKSKEQAGPNAFERGQSQQKRQQHILSAKRQRQSEDRKLSLERGEKALQKISAEKEYQNYFREAEEEQKQYNLDRIAQGKKNQFVGIKPLTKAQLSSNKQLRDEQQFEKMFLAPQVEVYQKPAQKYLVIEKKYQFDRQSQQPSASYHHSYATNNNYHNQEQSEEEDLEPRQQQVVPTRVKAMAETRADEVRPKQQLYYSQSQEEDSSVHQ